MQSVCEHITKSAYDTTYAYKGTITFDSRKSWTCAQTWRLDTEKLMTDLSIKVKTKVEKFIIVREQHALDAKTGTRKNYNCHYHFQIHYERLLDHTERANILRWFNNVFGISEFKKIEDYNDYSELNLPGFTLKYDSRTWLQYILKDVEENSKIFDPSTPSLQFWL